jgi:glycosyltransferase involved in cell wall biosynthesis
LKIALDATYSVGNNLSGVGVYSREMLHGLPSAHPEARFLYCFRPHRFLRGLRLPHARNVSRRLLIDHCPPSSAGVFHGTNQRLPEGRLRRAVSTFHDLFVLTGDYSTPEFRRRFAAQARDAAARADLIITVSGFTASQVEGLLGVEQGRIRVIHHGVRPPAPSDVPREPVILHVGAIQARKNIIRLIEAFESTAPDWRLVLAGSTGFGAEEILRRIEASSRRDSIEVLGYVSAAELPGLYHRASIFAFPSLDEGFGMPVLDAMAAGVPVVTSNRSALPEVAGDAALLVDPNSTESIAEAIGRLTISEELRKEMIGRGLRRAAQFTWEDAVRKTWSVYEELLG